MLNESASRAAEPDGARVLVVDDDEDTCRSTAMAIELKGHEARTAFSGRDAIAALPEFSPDLVLLDLSMPDMDGVQLARELRQRVVVPEPVIAAVSGYASIAHKRLCAKAGFDHYLTKPVDFTALEHLIQLANERAALQQDFDKLKRKHTDSFFAFCRSQVEFAGLVLDCMSAAPSERTIAKVERVHARLAGWLTRNPGFTDEQSASLQILLRGLEVRITTVKAGR